MDLATLALSFLLLWPSPAQAQTNPCPATGSTPQFTAGGNVFGRIASQWNAYFGNKVDINHGTLCYPTIYPPIPGATGADPTATIGLSAVPGIAQTFMRSDAAPRALATSTTDYGISKVDGVTMGATSGVTHTNPITINGASCANGGSCTVPFSGMDVNGSNATNLALDNIATAAGQTGGLAEADHPRFNGLAVGGAAQDGRTDLYSQTFLHSTLNLLDTSAAHYVGIVATSGTALTADRQLTVNMVNGARALNLGANLTLATDPGLVTGAMKSDGAGTFGQAACADLSNAGATCKATGIPLAVGWIATNDPNGAPIATIPQASTVVSIVGSIETPVGAAATVQVNKAPSGTACSAGTNLATGTLDANGTAATNQTLTLVGGATDDLAAGDRICLVTTGGTNWTGGAGIGGVTITVAPQ